MLTEISLMILFALGVFAFSIIAIWLRKEVSYVVLVSCLSVACSVGILILGFQASGVATFIDKQPKTGEHEIGCSFTKDKNVYIAVFNKKVNSMPKFYVFPEDDVMTTSTSKVPYFIAEKRVAGAEGKKITTAVLYQKSR